MSEIHDSAFLGHIEENSQGMGVPTPERVEQRARELAMIAGRSTTSVNDADRSAARLELVGELNPDLDGEDEEIVGGVRHWDEVPGTRGHHTESHFPTNEASLGEQLINEGMTEALHNEMLEAVKKGMRSSN